MPVYKMINKVKENHNNHNKKIYVDESKPSHIAHFHTVLVPRRNKTNLSDLKVPKCCTNSALKIQCETM